MPDLKDAACKGLPVDVFYDHENRHRGHGRDAAVTQARGICGRCPVRQECLTLAMDLEKGYSRYGIWGGLTADERSNLKRRQARAA